MTGTLTIWSDIGCPWASLFVWRAHVRRAALGLDDAVRLDHRCFPLELFNAQPTPRAIVDAEVSVLAALVPDAGWRPWSGEDSAYPVTTLPALEAVQAAKGQGLAASERLDLALRQAFWHESRCISMRHEILAIADEADVDVKALAEALDDGRARRAVVEDWHAAADGAATGSPYVGGRYNPGIEQHWEGPKPGGHPVVDRDDPSVVDELLREAASR